jgi:hypothetical protein
MAGTRFRARRTVGQALLFLIVFGLMIPIGMALSIWVDRNAGLAMTGFGGFVTILLALQVSAPRSRYRVAHEGIVLQRGLSRRELDCREIVGARVVSQAEAETMLGDFTREISTAEASLDAGTWLRKNRAYGRFTKFCTVPVVHSKTTVGNERIVTSAKAGTSGSFVLIKTDGGEHLLLSPREPEALLRALEKVASLPDPVNQPADGWAGSATESDTARRGRIKKAFTAYALVSCVILLGAAGYFYRNELSGILSGESYTKTPHPESGWVGDDAFRLVISIPPVTRDFYSEQEARRQHITREFDETYPSYAATELMKWYLREKDILPPEHVQAAIHDHLTEAAANLEGELLRADFNDDKTSLTGWIEVRETDLRDKIESIIEWEINQTSF